MTYTELCGKFNFNMPSYAADYYDGFMAQYDRNATILPKDSIITIAETTKIPDDAKAALINCAAIIDGSDDAHLCASFLAYITVYKRVPWVNYIYCDDLFTVEGLQTEQVGWVLVAVQLANTLINKKPPKELNEENIGAFRGYSQACFNEKGYWGILEWHWNMLCAGGCMFMFGILKYVPGEFTGDFPVITDGSSYISLAGGGFFVGKDGELVDCKEKSVFTTLFYEDDEKYIGHIIARDGTVDSDTTEFPKTIWRDYMRGGTHTIEIHIPQRIEYTPEKIKEAHKMALEFYKDFYPEHHPKAVACYSWLYSPQLKYVLKEDSNILKVNDQLHLLPIIESFDADCRFLRQGSSLQTRMAEECAKGREFHYGISYITLDEIEKLV